MQSGSLCRPRNQMSCMLLKSIDSRCASMEITTAEPPRNGTKNVPCQNDPFCLRGSDIVKGSPHVPNKHLKPQLPVDRQQSGNFCRQTTRMCRVLQSPQAGAVGRVPGSVLLVVASLFDRLGRGRSLITIFWQISIIMNGPAHLSSCGPEPQFGFLPYIVTLSQYPTVGPVLISNPQTL